MSFDVEERLENLKLNNAIFIRAHSVNKLKEEMRVLEQNIIPMYHQRLASMSCNNNPDYSRLAEVAFELYKQIQIRNIYSQELDSRNTNGSFITSH